MMARIAPFGKAYLMDYGQAFFLYIACLKLCDALVVAGVWYGCWYFRFSSALFPITKGIPYFENYSAVSLPLVIVFCAVFHIVGAYRRDRIHFGFRSLKKVIQGAVLGLLVFIATIYFKADVTYSRLYLILFLALLIPALVVERALAQIAWSIVESKLVKRIRLLLLGHGDLLNMYVGKLEKRQPYPIEWVGRLGEKVGEGPLTNIPYLGEDHRLPQILAEGRIDVLVISYPTDRVTKYSEILESVSDELITIKVLPDFGKYSTFSYAADQELGIPFLHFNKTPAGTTDRAFKRIVDIIGSAAFLLACSPIFFVVSVLIRLTSKGPIFYSQERMGADGRTFTLYKFRSMRIDAEKETGAVWAIKNDSRVTTIGKWMRKTSIDEFPQFYNVFRGDMSLVGPRPERPVFVDQFRKEVPKYMLRHKMKSGITGWAQVNGWRGNTSIDERIKHDLYYIGNWSHYFDFKILCLTFIKGFINRHAY